MANDDLTQFLVERVQAYDPTADVSAGSPIYTHIINPTLARLGVDPFSTDVRSFILARLSNDYPDMDISGAGNPLADIFVSFLETVLTPFRRELTQVKLTQSIADPSLLTDAEADSLMANLFEERQAGDFSDGTIRCYFGNKRQVDVDASVTATSTSGLLFYATESKTITADEMALNVEDGLYYVDLLFEASEAGTAFDIGSDSIASISGIPGIVKVANKDPFTGGVSRETTVQLKNRAETAISERSPNTDAGITNKLTSIFSDIRAIQPIGFNDIEMIRDVIKGTVTFEESRLGLGPVFLSGSDGTGVALTDSPLDTLVTDRTNILGSVGTDLTQLAAGDGVVLDGIDRTVSSVTDTDNLVFDDFQVLLSGFDGITTSYSPTVNSVVGATLLYSVALTDSTRDFVAAGVVAGDYLRVTGDWDPPAQPPGSPTGPGNMDQGYFKILSVTPNSVTIDPLLSGEITHTGNGSTGSNGVNVTNSNGQITLDSGATPNFYTGTTVAAGDWITLEDVTANGPFSPEEWVILSVDSAEQVTVAAGSPTESATLFEVDWAIRKRNAPQKALILGGISSVNWAVLRFRAGLDPDDDAYDWITGADTGLSFSARKQLTLADVDGKASLTISDIPLGITNPVTLEGTITVGEDTEVHVGGCTDAYIYQESVEAQTQDFTDTRDESPYISGTDLIVSPASNIVTSATQFTGKTLNNIDVLYILEGEYTGAYRILDYNSGSPRIDTTLTNGIASPGVDFYITKSSTINLTAPKVHRTKSGIALTTVISSAVVTDTTADFSALGVLVGDTVEIKSGEDKGTYTVSEVTSGTSLTLSSVMTTSASSITYAIYKTLDTLQFPFQRFTKVDMLGSDGTPSGIEIPYSEPVDIRSGALVNVTSGIKISGSDLEVLAPNVVLVPSEADIVRDRGIANGDILNIKSGPYIGSYVVYSALEDVGGSIVFTQPGPPLRENFSAVSVTVAYDPATLVGPAFVVGDTVTNSSGSRTWGTITADTGSVLTINWTEEVIQTLATATYKTAASSATSTSRPTSTPVSYEIGAPSIGTLRAYFLSPTYFKATAASQSSGTSTLFKTSDNKQYVPDYRFNDTFLRVNTKTSDGHLCPQLSIITHTGGTYTAGEVLLGNAGSTIGFCIDDDGTTLRACITTGSPPVVTDTVSGVTSSTADTVDAITTVVDALVSPATDFHTAAVEKWDRVTVTTTRLAGTVDVSGDIALNGLRLGLTVDNGPIQEVLFSGADPIAADSGTTGIIQQINAALTDVVATEYTDPAGTDYLALHSAKEIRLSTNARYTAHTPLGLSGNNIAINKDDYLVDSIYDTDVLLLKSATMTGQTASAAGLTAETVKGSAKFTVSEHGTQTLGPKEMALNTENGLYYMDIEVRSVYPGDTFNLTDDTALTSTNHISFGYKFSSRNDALTYSPHEEVDLILSPLVMDPLLDTKLSNAVKVPGADIRVYYEHGDTVLQAQSLLERDGDRVINNNPLARHMLPSYVRIDVNYTGGSQAAIVKQDIVDLINGTQPTVLLEVNDIYGIMYQRGAARVIGPLELVAVRYNVDRTIDTIRSKDQLTVGRVSKIIADEDNMTVVRS